MKKILFLLLLITSISQAQTTLANKLKITGNSISTTATKVNVQETDGSINWQFIKDFQNNKPYFSTGLLKNGLLTINADNTKFDLSAGIGVYSDFSDPENVTSKVFNFPAFNAVVSPYIATSNITYVAVNYNGGSPVLVMQAAPFSNTQMRDLVVVGAVIHSNFTTINTINNISSPSNDVGNSVADLFNFLGARNQEGNVYSANGANLQLNKSAGVILKYGANFHVNAKNPHNVSLPEQLSLTFRYRLQGGFEGTDRINVDVDNYDLNNILTAVPNNKYTIQTIFIPQTGQTRIQYGQTTYNTLADAIAAINTRKFNVETNLATQFVKVAYLVVKKGTTSLQVVTDSDIIQASKFDATASGGVAITYQSVIDALGFTPANDANVVKLTGNQDIDGIKSLKQRLFFKRSLDDTPTASIGFADTGFNFSIDAGGGGSFVSFKNAGSEVGRFDENTGGFLVNKTVGIVGYKFEMNGKAFISDNVGAKNFTDLTAKRWVIFGDSFSNDFPTDYVGVVRDNLDVTAVTYAVSGASSASQLAELKGQITVNPDFLDDFDIISLHIGVNDYANGAIALGSIDSTIGSGSISANIKEFIEVALTSNPLIKVFIITPIEANGGTSGLTYKTNNASGWNLENLSLTITNICKYYSVQCVDLYSLAQINLKTIPTLLSDGLHPNNTTARKWIGDIVSRAFVSNNSFGLSSITDLTNNNYIPKSNFGRGYKNSIIQDDGNNITVNGGQDIGSSEYRIESRTSSNLPRFDFVNNSNYVGQFSASSTDLIFKAQRQTNGNITFLTRTTEEVSTTEKLKINNSGVIQISNLIGTGSRLVTVDASGNLSAPDIPTAPTAAAGTNTGQVASTAFVGSAVTTSLSNVVTLTGTQTITGTKTFDNSSAGSGIVSQNSSTGIGINSVNSSTGIGIRSDNNSTGIGIFSANAGVGDGIVSRQTGTGFNYVGQNNLTNTFTVDKSGTTTATSFINSTAPATNALLANGTTLANPISGSGTTGYLQKVTSAGVLGNSIVSESGNIVTVTGGILVNANGVSLGGRSLIRSEVSNGDLKIFQYNNVGGYLRDALAISNSTGAVTFSSSVTAASLTATNLAGTGTRTVVTDASGNLSAVASVDSRPYKVYTALLTQSGTSAPVATVLENTLGTITLNYTSAGSFTATSSALFTLNKTTVFTQELFGLDSKSFQQVTGTSNINLYTSSGGSYISGLYNNTLIEIRVYN